MRFCEASRIIIRLMEREREIGRLSAEEKKKGKEEMEYIRKDHDMNFLVLLLGELR